jgi:acetyl esterase/lipase
MGAAAVVAGMAYLQWHAAPPTPDAFYVAPGAVPSRPGVLLRHEPYGTALPPGARGWRILYTTSAQADAPTVASAVVIAAASAAPGSRPVILWAHGTTGAVPGCAPSVLPGLAASVPALAELLAESWVLVAPDYMGLGTSGPFPYLIGEGEARSALDAVRAARELDGLAVDQRTIVWGHSQGGHAALWAGLLGPRYAPDVPLAGVAALAPATELIPLVDAAQHTVVGRIMSAYVMQAYGDAYPDIVFDDYVGPTVRGRGLARRCLAGRGALLSVLTSATMERAFFTRPIEDGPLGRRLRENTPQGTVAAPLFIGQGLTDDVVLPAVQEGFVRRWCDQGQRLEYRTYAGRDHMAVVAVASPPIGDLLEWTRSRLDGRPAAGGCTITPR